MEKKIIYLDHAATTAVHPDVLKEMLPYFTEKFGNPSSVYGFAAGNKNKINHAREVIAESIGAEPEEIYFTGGGSESDNWALKGVAEAYASKGRHIITTKIEHHAILHTCEYLETKKDTTSHIWTLTKQGWSGWRIWSVQFVRIQF